MSESRLWDRLRGAIGRSGHFVRLEFNPEAGIPDVDYCVHGEEGKIELKHVNRRPSREGTAVFTNGGLRDQQVVWIHQRVRHGGRVWILPQIGERLFLVPGSYCRGFNGMTYHQIEKVAVWSNNERVIMPEEWANLVLCLRSRT